MFRLLRSTGQVKRSKRGAEGLAMTGVLTSASALIGAKARPSVNKSESLIHRCLSLIVSGSIRWSHGNDPRFPGLLFGNCRSLYSQL
jgi:hypothetical protein